MPEYALWTLVVSLIVYSLAVSCKAAFLFFSLKIRDKQINSFIKKIDTLNEKHDKTISDISELNDAAMNKILKNHNRELQILFKEIIKLQKPKETLAQLIETYNKTTQQ